MLNYLADDLKRNTKVMTETFRKFNLRVSQFVYVPYDENDDECDWELLVELEGTSGGEMPDDGMVKINFYNSRGELIMSEGEEIEADRFGGFDTCRISLYKDAKFLKSIGSAKLYMGGSN